MLRFDEQTSCATTCRSRRMRSVTGGASPPGEGTVESSEKTDETEAPFVLVSDMESHEINWKVWAKLIFGWILCRERSISASVR